MLQESSEAIAGNIDILTEILLRLPPKPLGKFKSVSKQWLALISDPKFCHSHTLRHHPLPSALLLSSFYFPSPYFDLVSITTDSVLRVPPFDYLNAPRVSILQSCNGLLLCSSALVGDKEIRYSCSSNPYIDHCDSVVFDDNRGFRYFVCNPTTTQFATVSFPNKKFGDNIISLSLAFDPLRSPYYKIVSIRDITEGNEFVINVYSSYTGSWSDPDVCFTPPRGLAYYAPAYINDAPAYFNGAPVYFNGAILWLWSSDYEGKNSLYFDVESQCLNKLPMPPGMKFGTLDYFGECGGHCHMVVTEKPRTHFNILELKEDFSGWFVRYRVDLTPMQVAFPELTWDDEDAKHPFAVLGVFQQPREQDSKVVVLVNGTAMCFNLATHASRKLSDLCEAAGDVLAYDWRDAFLYFENLTYVIGFPISSCSLFWLLELPTFLYPFIRICGL
ncbi:F-box protein [Senna tora]|uniref:F-box protein n=1 Tax=Senna tora TaxID=362788 RepID=A0A834TBY8_9FABA|nr:F-box protein [Senna tora]